MELKPLVSAFIAFAAVSSAPAANWSSPPTFVADDLADFPTLNITTNAVTTLDGSLTLSSPKFGDATSSHGEEVIENDTSRDTIIVTIPTNGSRSHFARIRITSSSQ